MWPTLNSLRGFDHHDGTSPHRMRTKSQTAFALGLRLPDRWGRYCSGAADCAAPTSRNFSKQIAKDE
jgi:hypothetical protein